MQYYAHGKLLLSGEYLVLKASRALAIPTRFGQSLSFLKGDETLSWKSYNNEGSVWFEATFSKELEIISSTSVDTASFLKDIIGKGVALSGKALPTGKIETRLEFPQNWGLGSSSTLTYLIAQWLGVNAFELLFATQNGSGYDIACASANGPIIYTRTTSEPIAESVSLPEIFNEAYFIHLNKKQNSRPAVTNFLKNDTSDNLIQQVSDLTDQMLLANDQQTLCRLIDEHENLMSTVLQTPAVKTSLFPDFEGSVKSLGAWGGDFVMAIGNNVKEYFTQKGYNTILSFQEMT